MDFTHQAQGRAAMLKSRSNRCRCRYCGGELSLKSIVFSDFIDARVELYCYACDRIEFGVEAEIYASAKYFTEAMNYNCYPDLEDNEVTQRMTVAKICDIMAWQDKNLGFMDEHGFKVPLTVAENILGECMLFTDNDLQ